MSVEQGVNLLVLTPCSVLQASCFLLVRMCVYRLDLLANLTRTTGKYDKIGKLRAPCRAFASGASRPLIVGGVSDADFATGRCASGVRDPFLRPNAPADLPVPIAMNPG
jgi:hypothetical protein